MSGSLRVGSYEQYEDLDPIEVQVAVVRRKTDRAFQLMVAGFRDHLVAVWVPKSLMRDQGLDAGQRDRTVRIPSWLWKRICTEVKEQY